MNYALLFTTWFAALVVVIVLNYVAGGSEHGNLILAVVFGYCLGLANAIYFFIEDWRRQ